MKTLILHANWIKSILYISFQWINIRFAIPPPPPPGPLWSMPMASFGKYNCQIQITQIWVLSESLEAFYTYMFEKYFTNKIEKSPSTFRIIWCLY
jgi:hypothetical protein